MNLGQRTGMAYKRALKSRRDIHFSDYINCTQLKFSAQTLQVSAQTPSGMKFRHLCV